jgi:flagellum-specific peptidoglycan hydrolase FlgJ
MKKLFLLVTTICMINSCKVTQIKPYNTNYKLDIRKTNNAYVDKWSPIIIYYCNESGLPHDVPIAMCILESNSGKSRICVQKKNHVGMMWGGRAMSFQSDTVCIEQFVNLLQSRYYNYKTNTYDLSKYAKDPKYGKKLRKIIKDEKLASLVNFHVPLFTKIKFNSYQS